MKENYQLNFGDRSTVRGWHSINDVVMGGRSTSDVTWQEEKGLVFEGHVSLENGGGFASIRSGALDLRWGGYRGVEILSCGDGKTYRLRFKMDHKLDGVVYQASWRPETTNWSENRIPFADFSASYRGRSVPEAPKLDPDRIRQVGLLIAEKQQGPFKLVVRGIRPYQD